jgi:site-specific DNA-methyltransferase (adenine-specific)
MVAHRRGGKIKWEWQGKGPETANVVRIGKVIPTADDHPTPKPHALIAHFLRLHGKPGDTLLDPFMGHGPTLRVAKDMGISAIGIEVDESFCEVAAKELSQEALPFGPPVDDLYVYCCVHRAIVNRAEATQDAETGMFICHRCAA